MQLKNLHLLYFSATKTTQNVVERIAETIRFKFLTVTNQSYQMKRKINETTFDQQDFTIIAAPVYSGRIPPIAADFFSKFKANNTPAIIIVLYGNRDFGYALLELKDIAEKQGFIPLACGAFIGEHSFSCKDFPIAKARPDANDFQQIDNFANQILKKIDKYKNTGEIAKLSVPGNRPYKELIKIPPICITEINEKCNFCGKCAESCPMGAISKINIHETEIEKCIFCCACIRYINR